MPEKDALTGDGATRASGSQRFIGSPLHEDGGMRMIFAERYAYLCGAVKAIGEQAGWRRIRFEDYYHQAVIEHEGKAAYLMLAGPGLYTVDIYSPASASNPTSVTHTASLDAALRLVREALR